MRKPALKGRDCSIDVVSIAEAALRPNVHFVPVKSIAQQDMQLLGRIRERLIAQRSAIFNQIRGLTREYGVNFAKNREALLEQLPTALGDAQNDLSSIAREELRNFLQEVRHLTRGTRRDHEAGYSTRL